MAAQTVPRLTRKRPPPAQRTWKQALQSWPAQILKKFILMPLVGVLVSGMIIGRLADLFIGPKAYAIYVVGDVSDRSAKNMLEAARGQLGGILGGIPLRAEVRNDLGDPEKARTLAYELARRSDVLMVIGHGSSTVTQEVLPVYMNAEPPIPVVLTTETNPRLLPPPAQTDDSVPPVFRVFPTDDNQAIVAADFTAEQLGKSVWIIEDTSNPTYSHYLAQAFLKALYDRHPSVHVVLWSNDLNLPPYAVERLGIGSVFFAGDWRNALVLIRQLHALFGTNGPKVLLSDAAADKSLYRYGGADAEGVYLLHPLSADLFNTAEYVAVGEDAHCLATALLEQVNENYEALATEGAPLGYRVRKWLGLRRVGDARRAVARYMEKAVNNRILLTSSGRTFKMGKDETSHAVVREDAAFHVWRIERGNFVQVR